MTTRDLINGLSHIADREGLFALLIEFPLKPIAGNTPPPVTEMKYGQMLELRRNMGTGDDLAVIDTIGRVMLDRPLSDEPYEAVMPYILRVLRFVENSVKKEAEKLKYAATKDEKAAGIDRLNVFGEWGAVDTIVRSGRGYKHAEVYELPYNEVFLMQWHDLEESKFQRRLMKIQSKANEKH
jgi:hypothetical protein